MKVAIDVSPLKSAHQFRGVGKYTERLLKALKKVDKKILITDYQKADVIHYPYFDLFQLTLPWRKPKPVVVTIHDLIPLVFPKQFPKGVRGWLKFQIQKQSLRGAAAIITDSKNSKRDIIEFIGFPAERIFVVYLAAAKIFKPITSHQSLSTVRQKYGLPKNFILYVGDVNYHKNILGLVAASKKVGLPVVIVGKQAAETNFDWSHPENQPLVQLIKEFGQDPDVLRIGFVPEKDLVVIYSLASVYCQPSFYEGFGLPVLEAMQGGCPVVATQKGSLPEICGKAAVMVVPTVDKIAAGIKKALGERKQLIKNGLAQSQQFNWQKTARQTIKAYEKVLAKKS